MRPEEQIIQPSNDPPDPFQQPGQPGQSYNPGPSQLPPPQGPQQITPLGPVKKKKFTKIRFLQIALVLMIVGSVLGYLFLFLPNRPANIWANALENTSKGYDHLVSYAEEKKDFTTSKMKGNYKVEGSVASDGSFELTSNEKDMQLTFDVGALGSRINAEARLITPENANYPDVYFKATGIKGLGEAIDPGNQSGISAMIDGLDGQWIVVDHTIFDQMEESEGEGIPQLTQDDMLTIAKAVGKVNNEYLFTKDESKAVFKVAESIGKEEKDGRSVYHFKVGIDKEHMKSYLNALKDELNKTKLAEMTPEKDLEKSTVYAGFKSVIEDLDGDEKFDVYVDMKTKLIRAVRFTEKDNSNNYLELSMPYDGGDEFPFVLDVKDTKDGTQTAKVKVSVNTGNDVVKLEAKANVDYEEEDGEDFGFSLNAEGQPSKDPVEITKPEGAKPWMEVLGPLMNAFYGYDTTPTEPGPELPLESDALDFNLDSI